MEVWTLRTTNKRINNNNYNYSQVEDELKDILGTNVKINGKKYVYIYTPVGNTKAMICTLIPQSNVLGQVGSIKYITIFMVILAAGAALVTGFVISTGISKTVREMSGGLAKVAQGDLTQDFTTKRQDEFKELTGSLTRYPVVPIIINSVAPPFAPYRRIRKLGENLFRG